MVSFIFGRRQEDSLPNGIFTIRKGLNHLYDGDYETAIATFRKVAASRNPRTSRLVKSVANFYAYNADRLREEAKKNTYGNARRLSFRPAYSRDAWSDVDIAAILVAPLEGIPSSFLAKLLGRSPEAVRFQRRYAFKTPLPSWQSERGDRYTRYTQTRTVAKKIGLV